MHGLLRAGLLLDGIRGIDGPTTGGGMGCGCCWLVCCCCVWGGVGGGGCCVCCAVDGILEGIQGFLGTGSEGRSIFGIICGGTACDGGGGPNMPAIGLPLGPLPPFRRRMRGGKGSKQKQIKCTINKIKSNNQSNAGGRETNFRGKHPVSFTCS